MSDAPKSSEDNVDGNEHSGDDTPRSRGRAEDTHPNTEATPKQSGMGMAIGVLGFVVALGGGFFLGSWWNNREAASQVQIEQGPRYKVNLSGDEAQLGPDDALVTIIEFADYQCPYCVQAAGPVKKAAEGDDDVRLIYMHYPLPGHVKAGPAAQAAWAAQQQGKFWEMHAWLFEQKSELDGLEAKVKSLGLDWSRFQSDMLSDEASAGVDANFLAGAQAGVTGTPTFFVNGRRYVGARSVADWKKIIAAEKRDAKRLLDAGTPRAEVFARLMKDAVQQQPPAKPKPQARAPAPKQAGPDPAVEYHVPADGRPTLGPDDALVTIVHFSDFESTFSQRAAPILQSLVERHDDVRIVFRNFPLSTRERGKDPGKAALAAHRQGKFWEMHDALFANRSRLGEEPWRELAEEIGLDVERFEADMADPEIATMIEQDIDLGTRLAVNSTPVAFVNGRYIFGAQPVTAYDDLIEQGRARARTLVEAGTSSQVVYAELIKDAQKEVSDNRQ